MSKAVDEAMPRITSSLTPIVSELLEALGVTDIGAAVERVIKRVHVSLDSALTEVLPPAEGCTGGSLLDGYFTLEYADGRPHRTLRIETPDKGSLAGKTILSYLAGPNNTDDYVSFAFVDVERRRVNLWKRFSGNHDLLEAAQILLGDPRKAGLAYALESNRCFRCNRTLTVPASVHRGLGPICSGVVGNAY